VVVEAADLVEVDYIVEAGHIAGIVETKGIAEDTHQEKMTGIAVEEMDIVDLVLLAGGDSSVLCK
jgi:hypothetical protein